MKMRKFGIPMALLSVVIAASSCSSKEMTIENINLLIDSKEKAIEIYDKCSIIANQDTLPKIAEVFETAAKSAGIHITILENELQRIRGKRINNKGIESIEIPVSTTKTNLYNAKANSEYKVMSLLPEMIEIAGTEKSSKSQEIISGIMQSEEQQIENFVNAIHQLEECGSDSLMVVDWYCCLKCGNISNSSECTDCD